MTDKLNIGRRKKSSLLKFFMPVVVDPKVDERRITSVKRSYSYKVLQSMTEKLGLFTNVSKDTLAKSYIIKKNIYSPGEKYTHEQLIHIIQSLNIKKLTRKEHITLTNPQLEKIIAKHYNGGDVNLANNSFQRVLELYKAMKQLETKFCSEKIKKSLHKRRRNNMSIRDYVDKRVEESFDIFSKWTREEVLENKRGLYHQLNRAREKTERAILDYLDIIRKNCSGQYHNVCDPKNMPKVISDWLAYGEEKDKHVFCNVRIEGRLVKFSESEILFDKYKVYHVINVTTDKDEDVTWIGIARQEQTKKSDKSESEEKKKKKDKKKEKKKV